MKSLGLLKDKAPDLVQLVDRRPFMQVLDKLSGAAR
jgi:hypothetical protein